MEVYLNGSTNLLPLRRDGVPGSDGLGLPFHFSATAAEAQELRA